MAEESAAPMSTPEPARTVSAWNPPAISSAQLRLESKTARAQEKVQKAQMKANKAGAKYESIQLKAQAKGARASSHLFRVQAKRELANTKAQTALAKYESVLEKDQREEELVKRGLRRQWLTGRVVPVKKSKTGAKAHTRTRPSRFSWGGPK